MRTDIQAKNFDLDDNLKNFISNRIDKLERFYDQIIDVIVYLNDESTVSKEVVIKLNVKDNTLLAREKAESFEMASDTAIEVIKRQLKKYKGRVQEK